MTMKVKLIVDMVLNLLGYTNENGNEQLTRRIMNKFIPVFNVVYAELFAIDKPGQAFVPVHSLTESVTMSISAMQALQYGVAGFLAMGEGDADNQSLWMNLYNQKRLALTKVEELQDVLPTPD